jgi:hypothetical protein
MYMSPAVPINRAELWSYPGALPKLAKLAWERIQTLETKNPMTRGMPQPDFSES